jgi:hypothetical protein
VGRAKTLERHWNARTPPEMQIQGYHKSQHKLSFIQYFQYIIQYWAMATSDISKYFSMTAVSLRRSV